MTLSDTVERLRAQKWRMFGYNCRPPCQPVEMAYEVSGLKFDDEDALENYYDIFDFGSKEVCVIGAAGPDAIALLIRWRDYLGLEPGQGSLLSQDTLDLLAKIEKEIEE